ncbi:class I SAM-dependent methyltransferase [Novosphingobium sp. AP12]|uniref:class I SAM-dependent methyltransferase n=1 Tax=Novosphingobium sp. AP12 TaxID=1144305 RepID=UPI0002722460|nr:class I SAM-dependent methyltransferase [Novosphingobium sp. AP12]EJL23518.1 methyltransferase family protein [Novosphingobium sp. AP12]
MPLQQLESLSITETACRSCGNEALAPILDLGRTPLADRLVPEHKACEPELTFPLMVAFCPECTLVQILETVSPEVLYAQDYPYFSSFSPALLAHSTANVLDRIGERALNTCSFVIELASNDGYLLRNYLDHGISVLGIDPAEGPVADAEKIGVRTLCAFFTEQLAHDVARDFGKADVVHGNNVLAHVSDTNGFVKGIRQLLKPSGVAVLEVPHLLPLMEHVEFDTIYHEHHCYFSMTALDKLFRRHGLFINRIEQWSLHGGSLRIFAEHTENVEISVTELLTYERAVGLDRIDYYHQFAARVDELRDKLVGLIRQLKAEGHSIAAYGAAAKGATLINYCGIDHEMIDFVVDRNENKHGLLMPGAKIPILAPKALLEARPDYVLVLAWNFIDEIIDQQHDFLAAGGKFILPVPDPRVL